jgi:DNA polymerase III delta prime subunit
MSMTFKDWFCLSGRETFTIDPKVNPADARFYFGRDQVRDRMKKQISRAFIDPQVPKMMIYGAYGSGKTQTLHYLAYDLVHATPKSCKWSPHVVHLDIEVQSKSMADQWHLQMMESLGMATVQGLLKSLFDKSKNFEQEIDKLANDPNLAMAFKQLRGGGDLAFNAWRWLTGAKLTPKELIEIKVTRSLADVGVGDMVAALQAIGNLARSVGACLIFFIDEMEELINIKQGDAAESWHQYTRKLADNSNSSVGFVIGFKAVTVDEAPKMIVREDILSRISRANMVELETLSAPANVKTFVEEMLAHIVDQKASDKLIKAEKLPCTVSIYPFCATAFDLLCDYACQDAIKSTPRNIIRTINECAIAAWDAQKKFIDDDIVNEIAPIIFG